MLDESVGFANIEHWVEVDEVHEAVAHATAATDTVPVKSGGPKFSPVTTIDRPADLGLFVGVASDARGASNESNVVPVPATAPTVTATRSSCFSNDAAVHTTEVLEDQPVVAQAAHDKAAEEVLASPAKLKPETVTDPPPLGGLFSSPYEATGASYEKPPNCVPATAPIVTVDTPSSTRGALDAQLTDVEEVQDDVPHAACASSAVALKP
jgi:hypothetical protein